MLRLYKCNGIKENKNIEINEIPLVMDNNLWKNCQESLKECEWYQDGIIHLIPIVNIADELIAYGYQDNEANREFRMLKELRENEDALQFEDIFPEYKEVIICGCNELAMSFAEYLKEHKIPVSVIGKYWSYFGYENNYEIDLDGEDKLVVYAEGITPQNGVLYETVIRSVSPEFECIDKIYEANVLQGKIHNVTGSFDEVIQRLRDEPEIIILGKDKEAQDVYDLLMKHGIDIYGFAVEGKNGEEEKLLGKYVMSIDNAVKYLERPIFLNYRDTCGALGEEWTEYFDYRGYKRNRQFFLLKDYTDIPDSNLVHVLHGRRVLLTGDPRLCRLLSDYLNSIECGEVIVQYISLTQKVSKGKDDILCLVIPDYHNRLKDVETMRKSVLKQQLSDMGFTNYTEYFINSRSFVLIDLYLNHNMEKYKIPDMTPKGICLGAIPGWSGNVFFRGVMDGHPEILLISYSDLNENLFYYCIRLANVDSDRILSDFWEMYNAEARSQRIFFKSPKSFEANIKQLLKHKKSFTSQELFVLFHIAYAEMLSGKQIEDISKLVIYWEPHFVPRDEFPFFALWLEDKKIKGHTVILRRNNTVRTGSACARKADGWSKVSPYRVMFTDMSGLGERKNLQYHHWSEYKMRFEDIKIRPGEILRGVCKKLDIKWSDNMLRTTDYGKPLTYRGSVDFDLKSVFNKYEEYLSEVDRFRISIASSPYQKRYGFTYENCLKFSRRELQELFLKPFLFDEIYGYEVSDYIKIYEWMKWQLWNVRKHMILNDICPELERFELKQTATECIAKYKEKKIAEIMKFIREHDKLILYGTGDDCEQILKLIDADMKERFLYSDKRAETQSYIFKGKKVLAPQELIDRYMEYYILVTSSQYYRNIEEEFTDMGISPGRVFYNEVGISE